MIELSFAWKTNGKGAERKRKADGKTGRTGGKKADKEDGMANDKDGSADREDGVAENVYMQNAGGNVSFFNL